tara:strand:+ start:1336 stop:3105 length:1770 start_codon:yes stop_codon:yes gene_type:complete
MAEINGTADWGIVPLDWDGSQLSYMSLNYRFNYLKSANDQLRYEIVTSKGGEGAEPAVEGDVVNVIFKVETSVTGNYWTTIGTIKKSRDITNKRYYAGNAPAGHRFTVDVSQLVADQLSYSLCPINKGTWQSNFYGGMNGGLTMQDNVINKDGISGGSAISIFNVSDNGTFRRLRVSATFEIIGDAENNGALEIATDDALVSQTITAINSVNQFERDSVFYRNYNVDLSTGYNFLTRCPNWSGGSVTQDFKKPVRIDQQAEWLQFYVTKGDSTDISSAGGGSDIVGAMGIEIKTYIGNTLENTFYLDDFQQNVLQSIAGGFAQVNAQQNQMFIQNISPYYINNTAALKALPANPPTRSTTDIAGNWNAYTGNKITNSTTRYTANLVKVGLFSPYTVLEVSYSYNYTIDRESENIPYGYVRFHWLNSLGAIDSYTAKRDVVEGLTISRDVIERKSGDRTWYQADSNYSDPSYADNAYISDTMRGGDIYKGGREVTNVNADRVQSVYTEPLNKSVATWLEEIMLSPNVWIEKDTEATKMGNTRNPYLRPSTKEYIPVIITNSDIETVNQENGLVRFNIEYTLAHKVQTQRN